MKGSIATLIYVVGIAGLFYLNRDKTTRTSPALWLPIIWLGIIGSKSPSIWFGLSAPAGTDAQMDGTPSDRLIFLFLLFAAVMVLFHRGQKVSKALLANWPIVAFYVFCLMSVAWSDFPGVASKRWFKAIGDLAMVLIIITDENPICAFKRVVSRVGFVLLPVSILLIKYFPTIGRGYDKWYGTVSYFGVTTDKNVLGVIVYVTTLATFWSFLTLYRDKEQPNRTRQLVAQGVLLFCGLYLLRLDDSATSRASLALGSLLIIATSLRSLRRSPGMIYALVITILLIGADVMLLGGGATFIHALGRKSDLTGRTGIWAELIPMAPNPLLGAGFESFWLGPRLQEIHAANPGNPLNEAHNGYIEIYLQLGCVGLILLATMLVRSFRNAVRAIGGPNPALGSLLLAYTTAATIYGITEAGFRNLNPNWFYLLCTLTWGASLASGALTVEGTALAPAVQIKPTRIALPTRRNSFDVGSLGRRA